MCRAGDSIAHCSERPKSTEPIRIDAWIVPSTKHKWGVRVMPWDSQSLYFPHINIIKRPSHGSDFCGSEPCSLWVLGVICRGGRAETWGARIYPVPAIVTNRQVWD